MTIQPLSPLSSEQFNYPKWLQNFVDVYQQLGTENHDLLDSVYHEDVEFLDPMHHLQGKSQLLDYFGQLYSNVSYCQFNIDNIVAQDNQAAVYWRMSFAHRRLAKGKTITVEGSSLIKGEDDYVVYHRDYIDLGAMLYEHIPALGAVVRAIKKRASS